MISSAQEAKLLAQLSHRFFVLRCAQWIERERVIKNKLIVLSVVMLVLVLAACNAAQPDRPSQPVQTGLGVQPQATTSGALAAPQPTNNAGESMSGPVPTGDTNTSIGMKQHSDSKITTALATAVAENSSQIDFCVTLTRRATIDKTQTSGMDATTAREYAIRQYKDVANHTQTSVKAELEMLKLSGEVSSYESYWIFNGLCIKGTAKVVNQLAQRSDIRVLELNSNTHEHNPNDLGAPPTASSSTGADDRLLSQ